MPRGGERRESLNSQGRCLTSTSTADKQRGATCAEAIWIVLAPVIVVSGAGTAWPHRSAPSRLIPFLHEAASRVSHTSPARLLRPSPHSPSPSPPRRERVPGGEERPLGRRAPPPLRLGRGGPRRLRLPPPLLPPRLPPPLPLPPPPPAAAAPVVRQRLPPRLRRRPPLQVRAPLPLLRRRPRPPPPRERPRRRRGPARAAHARRLRARRVPRAPLLHGCYGGARGRYGGVFACARERLRDCSFSPRRAPDTTAGILRNESLARINARTHTPPHAGPPQARVHPPRGPLPSRGDARRLAAPLRAAARRGDGARPRHVQLRLGAGVPLCGASRGGAGGAAARGGGGGDGGGGAPGEIGRPGAQGERRGVDARGRGGGRGVRGAPPHSLRAPAASPSGVAIPPATRRHAPRARLRARALPREGTTNQHTLPSAFLADGPRVPEAERHAAGGGRGAPADAPAGHRAPVGHPGGSAGGRTPSVRGGGLAASPPAPGVPCGACLLAPPCVAAGRWGGWLAVLPTKRCR